jgi:uncharacterized membrane protein
MMIWFSLSAAHRGNNSARALSKLALKRRYAHGEMDSETYEQMLEDLRK